MQISTFSKIRREVLFSFVQALAVTTLIYGNKTWNLMVKEEARIAAF